MEWIQTFLLATLMSIIGFLPPGMINMTTVKVSIEQSKANALKFISGTLVIIAIQATIAITFSKYLASNQLLLDVLSYAGIGVFLLLSFMFYRQAKHSRAVGGLVKGTFLSGVKMASMNMLAIPFFLGYSTAMEASGLIMNGMPNNLFFVAGAVTGCFILFSIYMLLAKVIEQRVAFVARNINYILSILFLVLAVVTCIKLVLS